MSRGALLCSVDEKEEVFSFLMASHTLMVILLLISAALQFSTIALSTGCPCALITIHSWPVSTVETSVLTRACRASGAGTRAG